MNSHINRLSLLLTVLAFATTATCQTKDVGKWEEVSKTDAETYYIKANGIEEGAQGRLRVWIKNVPSADSAEGKKERDEQIEGLRRIKRENPEFIYGDPDLFGYGLVLEEIDCKSRKWRPLIHHAYSSDGGAIYRYSLEKRPPDWSLPPTNSVAGAIVNEVCERVGKQ